MRLQAQGIRDAEKGVSARGSYMADSPIFQAAYQESHLETSLNIRLAKEERERNWNEYALDVDNGHNRLQSDLLDLGEELMAGHSPELQSKFYSQYRNWANQKMLTQAEGARLQRLKNIGEDATNDVMSLLTTNAPLEAIMARVEETNNLAAAGGAENPSSYGANAVMVAAELEGRTDVLQALVNDKDHMKTFSSEQRKAIQDKMQSLEKEDRAERNYMETQMNKQFAKAKGQIALDAIMQFAENPEAGPQIAKNLKGQMVALAKEDPKNAMSYLDLADSMYNTMIPDPEDAGVEMTVGELALAKHNAEKELTYYLQNADLENPETASNMDRILAGLPADERSKVAKSAISALNEDDPLLSTVEAKSAMNDLKRFSGAAKQLMTIVGGEATFLEPNNMGVSTFQITMEHEFRKAVREGSNVQEAKRIAFGIAASEAGLYDKINKNMGRGKETTNYRDGLSRIPGMVDIFFNNPHYNQYKSDNEAAAKKFEQENIELKASIPPLKTTDETQ